MDRAASFLAGCVLITAPCIIAVYAEPPYGEAWAATNADLCTSQHPKQRSKHVKYGGYSPQPGYERDHIVPLCLGGTDTPANLTYQPLDEARAKDRLEWAICEYVCESGAPVAIYQHMFLGGKWRQSYENWFDEAP